MKFYQAVTSCVLLSVLSGCNLRPEMFQIKGPIQLTDSAHKTELYSATVNDTLVIDADPRFDEANVYVERSKQRIVFQLIRRGRLESTFFFDLSKYLSNAGNWDLLAAGNVVLPADISKQLLDLRFQTSEVLVSQTISEEEVDCQASEAGSGVSTEGRQLSLVEKRVVRVEKLLELFKPNSKDRVLFVEKQGEPVVRLKVLKALGPCNPAPEKFERPRHPLM